MCIVLACTPLLVLKHNIHVTNLVPIAVQFHAGVDTLASLLDCSEDLFVKGRGLVIDGDVGALFIEEDCVGYDVGFVLWSLSVMHASLVQGGGQGNRETFKEGNLGGDIDKDNGPLSLLRTRSTAPEQPPQVMVTSNL